MPVGSSLSVNRAAQVKGTDNGSRPEVKVPVYQVNYNIMVNLGSTESFNRDRERMGNANNICNLEFQSLSQTGGNYVFGYIASHIGS